MAVYVDDMRAPYGRLIMSHMIADTDEELHKMAQAIGVARKWWQSPEKTSGSHYDICQSMKAKAIERGAIQITLRECAIMNRIRMKTGKLGSLHEAQRILRDRWLMAGQGIAGGEASK